MKLAPTNDAIRVNSLTKSFARDPVLKDVTLGLRQGETVAILGPSGSGKSTLCRTMIGLEPFELGEIRVFGEQFLVSERGRVKRDSGFARIRLQMGMVFQDYTLMPTMTLLGNLSLGPRRVLKLDADLVREQSLKYLEEVGLKGLENSYPAHLSGGQKQRAAIARELAMDRRILFFDEVTSALDPELVAEVLEVMKQLASGDGKTLVVVTHELNFARHVADRIVFMDDGHILEVSTPDQFFTKPSSERAAQFLDRVLQ